MIKNLLILVIVAVAGFTGWYAYHSKKNTDAIYNRLPSIQQVVSLPKKAAATVNSAAPATYDHGIPVPADSQVRAKSVDYYCPGWDGQPGHLTPDFCAALDN